MKYIIGYLLGVPLGLLILIYLIFRTFEKYVATVVFSLLSILKGTLVLRYNDCYPPDFPQGHK